MSDDDGALIPTTDITSVEERAYRAYQMRLGGKSWQNIKADLNYASVAKTKEAVDRLINKAAKTMVRDRREEIMDIELDRLDALQDAIWGMAMVGDLKAVDSVLKVMTHRAKLLALGNNEDTGSQNTVIVASSDYIQTLKNLG